MSAHRTRTWRGEALRPILSVAIACGIVAASGGLAASAGATARPSDAQTPTVKWIRAHCQALAAEVFKADFHLVPSPVHLAANNCLAYYGYDATNESTKIEIIIDPGPAAQVKANYELDYTSAVNAVKKDLAPGQTAPPGQTAIDETMSPVANVGTTAFAGTSSSSEEVAGVTSNINAVFVDSYKGFVRVDVAAYNYSLSTSAMAAISRLIYSKIASGVK